MSVMIRYQKVVSKNLPSVENKFLKIFDEINRLS